MPEMLLSGYSVVIFHWPCAKAAPGSRLKISTNAQTAPKTDFLNLNAAESEVTGTTRVADFRELGARPGIVPAGTRIKVISQALSMRRIVEHLFELIEANTPYAVCAVVASLAITGCLRFILE
ncbi:MAG: hypothetical protein ABI561_14820 [Bradyrhizobium sp.]